MTIKWVQHEYRKSCKHNCVIRSTNDVVFTIYSTYCWTVIVASTIFNTTITANARYDKVHALPTTTTIKYFTANDKFRTSVYLRTNILLRVGESVRTRDCTAHVNERGQQQEMGSHVYVCVCVCLFVCAWESVRECRSQRARLRCCAGQLCLQCARVYTVHCLCLARFHDKEEARAVPTTGWECSRCCCCYFCCCCRYRRQLMRGT